MKQIVLILLPVLSVLSIASGQTQQADCNNLYLDTDTFYISYQQDTVVAGNLFYLDSTLTVYPSLHLILFDTAIITSPDIIALSFLANPLDTTEPFYFTINFKTNVFPNNTTVSGLFHIYDSDTPGDSIVTCYFPITIILQNPTGINETENKKLKIYPNPTVSELNIENNSTQHIQFTFYNSLGEKFIDKILANKTNTINLSPYSNDVYFYRVSTDKQLIKSGKIIKQ